MSLSLSAPSRDVDICGLCKTGHIVRRRRELAFHQWTDKGRIVCRVTVPVDVCDQCDATSWDETAEAAIAEAVRQEYEKLP